MTDKQKETVEKAKDVAKKIAIVPAQHQSTNELISTAYWAQDAVPSLIEIIESLDKPMLKGEDIIMRSHRSVTRISARIL